MPSLKISRSGSKTLLSITIRSKAFVEAKNTHSLSVVSALGITQCFESHHQVSPKTAQCHHLFRCSGVTDSVTLAFNPLEQFSGLVGPGAEGGPQQFIVVDRNVLVVLQSARSGLEQCAELMMTQRIRDGRVLTGGIGVDA